MFLMKLKVLLTHDHHAMQAAYNGKTRLLNENVKGSLKREMMLGSSNRLKLLSETICVVQMHSLQFPKDLVNCYFYDRLSLILEEERGKNVIVLSA